MHAMPACILVMCQHEAGSMRQVDVDRRLDKFKCQIPY